MELRRGSSATIVSIVIGVLVLIGLVYWFMQNGSSSDETTAEDIEQLGEELEDLPEADIPNADPLQDVIIDENPIDATNPFDDEYENPFNF